MQKQSNTTSSRTSPEDLKALSREQLEDLRDSLIDLSEAGYNVIFNLQIGIDQDGHALIFDMGKESLMYNSDKKNAYERNNRVWFLFLCTIGKKTYFPMEKSNPGRTRLNFLHCI